MISSCLRIAHNELDPRYGTQTQKGDTAFCPCLILKSKSLQSQVLFLSRFRHGAKRIAFGLVCDDSGLQTQTSSSVIDNESSM